VNKLKHWIECGLSGEQYRKKALVRRWEREARERRPIIDRITYPETGIDRRISIGRRAGDN
jgi:hypothetical protein